MGSAFIRRDTDFDYYCSYLLLMMNIFMINISLNNALLKRDIKNTEMPFHLKHFFCMFHTAWNIQQMNKSCSAMLHTIFPYLYHFLIYRFYDIHPHWFTQQPLSSPDLSYITYPTIVHGLIFCTVPIWIGWLLKALMLLSFTHSL